MMKNLILILFIMIGSSVAFSQYKGGSYDGFAYSFIGRYGQPDTSQLNKIKKGGSNDGYGYSMIGRWGQPDTSQTNKIKVGGSKDGYGFAFLGRWGQPDSSQLAKNWFGAVKDGYGYYFIGRWGQPDSAQLARKWVGSSKDGYGYALWRFFNLTYVVPPSWQHNENALVKSTISIPKTVICKIGTRTPFYGDGIGLFYTRNGVQYCAGYGEWDFTNLNITVYADDPLTPIKDGYDLNETYIFKFWDAKLGKEYIANAVYHSGSSDKFASGGISIVDTLKVTTTVKHFVKMNVGWNTVSSYAKPTVDTIKTLFNTINNNVTIVKNNAGQTYIPSFNIDNINRWNYQEGYKIYMSKADSLLVEGMKADPSQDKIILKVGWNTASYLRDDNVNIATCLTTLTDRNNLVIAKNNAGLTYIPSFGINNIVNMLPGQGYQMFLSAVDTIVYPAYSGGKLGDIPILTPSSKTLIPKYTNTGNNSTILVEVKTEDMNEIGVFNSQNELVGSGVVQNGIASITVWGDDESTDEYEGTQIGEELTLQLYNNSDNTLKVLELETIDNLIGKYKQSVLTYKRDGLVLAKTKDLVDDLLIIKVSPNPFSNQTTINYKVIESGRVTIKIVDLSGRLLSTLLNEEMKIGNYDLSFENKTLSSGVYNLVIESSGTQNSTKLIIQK